MNSEMWEMTFNVDTRKAFDPATTALHAIPVPSQPTRNALLILPQQNKIKQFHFLFLAPRVLASRCSLAIVTLLLVPITFYSSELLLDDFNSKLRTEIEH